MKILIIGNVWPEPNSSAAGKRMTQLIDLFSNFGEIHFACANQLTGNEIDFQKFGIQPHFIELNNDTVDQFFVELNPAIVVFDRFLTEEQYGWRIIEQCPNALRILDTEDLHFLRRTRHQFVKKNNAVANKLEALDFQNNDTLRELASIYRCDVSLIISPFEMELLTTEMQVPEELLYYLPIFSSAISETPTFEAKKDCLFIGNYRHEPNADAIRMLLEKGIWKNVSESMPEAQLIVVGAYQNNTISQYCDMSIKVKIAGQIATISEVYAPIKISLAPLRFGAGIKGKILEAMEQGVPFITTSIGAEGLFLDASWDACIADDWQEFEQKAITLYTDKEKWLHFQSKGWEHLQRYFSKQKHEQPFIDFVSNQLKNYAANRKKRYFSQLVQHHSLMSTRYLSKWIMEKNKNN